MSDTINPNAFGSARTRRWAERINKARNDRANKGFGNADKIYGGGAKANHLERFSKVLSVSFPPSDSLPSSPVA